MFKPLAVLTQGRYDYVNVEELGVAVDQRDVVSRVLASPVGLGAKRLRQCAGALPLLLTLLMGTLRKKGSLAESDRMFVEAIAQAGTIIRAHRIMPAPPNPMGRSECPTTEAPAPKSRGTERFHLYNMIYHKIL